MLLKRKLPLVPRFTIFWLVAMVFEYPFVLSLIAPQFSPPFENLAQTLALHLMAAVALLFSLPRAKGWLHRERSWPMAFFIFTLFLPLFGVIMSGLFFIAYRETTRPVPVFAEDEFFFSAGRVIDPADVAPPAGSLEEKVRKNIDFLPLVDILYGEDIALKRGAINKLAELATPEAIRILLAHRGDPSPEVRFFITSALVNTKKRFDEELEAAREAMKQNIDHIPTRLLLAKAYLRYARSGLPNEITQRDYLNEAVYHLRECLAGWQAGPALNAVAAEASRLLLEAYEATERWEALIPLIAEMQQRGFISEKEVVKKKLTSLYRSRQFEAFKRELKKMVGRKDIEPEWLAMAHWWGVSQ